MIEKRGFTIQESARIIRRMNDNKDVRITWDELIEGLKRAFTGLAQWIRKVFDKTTSFVRETFQPVIGLIERAIEKENPSSHTIAGKHKFMRTEQHLFKQSNIYYKDSKINNFYKGRVPHVPIQTCNPRIRFR